MNFSFPNRTRIRQGVMLAFLAGALTCMFPPAYPCFAWWSAQARFVALGYLLLGLLCLVANRVRLMIICFGCSAAISFYYYEKAGREIPAQAPASQSDQHSGGILHHFFYFENPVYHELASPCR